MNAFFPAKLATLIYSICLSVIPSVTGRDLLHWVVLFWPGFSSWICASLITFRRLLAEEMFDKRNGLWPKSFVACLHRVNYFRQTTSPRQRRRSRQPVYTVSRCLHWVDCSLRRIHQVAEDGRVNFIKNYGHQTTQCFHWWPPTQNVIFSGPAKATCRLNVFFL